MRGPCQRSTGRTAASRRRCSPPSAHALLPPRLLLKESLCCTCVGAGPVSKIRLLGDTQHNSKIAFVEFATAESARAALKLSGALLGACPQLPAAHNNLQRKALLSSAASCKCVAALNLAESGRLVLRVSHAGRRLHLCTEAVARLHVCACLCKEWHACLPCLQAPCRCVCHHQRRLSVWIPGVPRMGGRAVRLHRSPCLPRRLAVVPHCPPLC